MAFIAEFIGGPLDGDRVGVDAGVILDRLVVRLGPDDSARYGVYRRGECIAPLILAFHWGGERSVGQGVDSG